MYVAIEPSLPNLHPGCGAEVIKNHDRAEEIDP
jgi:hypothetical protein